MYLGYIKGVIDKIYICNLVILQLGKNFKSFERC